MKNDEMIGASERLVLFSIFFILLRINKLLVVVAWVFFLATLLNTVNLDKSFHHIPSDRN